MGAATNASTKALEAARSSRPEVAEETRLAPAIDCRAVHSPGLSRQGSRCLPTVADRRAIEKALGATFPVLEGFVTPHPLAPL